MNSRTFWFLIFIHIFGPGFPSIAAPFAIDAISFADPSLATNRSGHGISGEAQLTPDGRFVVFLSDAGDLVLNDHTGPGAGLFTDIFRKDLLTGDITLVSVNSDGEGGNGPSSSPL